MLLVRALWWWRVGLYAGFCPGTLRCRWWPSISAGGYPPALAAYPGFNGRASPPPARPCSGWGLPSRPGHPGRWCALTAPFHPYLCRRCPAIGGLFSVALSCGSPRLGVTQHPALWSPDVPRPGHQPVTAVGPDAAAWPTHHRTHDRREIARAGARAVPSGALGGAATDGGAPMMDGAIVMAAAGIRGNDRRDARGHDGGAPRRSGPRGAGHVPRLPRSGAGDDDATHQRRPRGSHLSRVGLPPEPAQPHSAAAEQDRHLRVIYGSGVVLRVLEVAGVAEILRGSERGRLTVKRWCHAGRADEARRRACRTR